MLRNRVRQFRQEIQWSQADVAKRIGISRQALRYIEAGDTVPSTLTALRLAQLFSVRVEDLFQTVEQQASEIVAAVDEDIADGDRVFLSDIGSQRVAHRLHPVATNNRNGEAAAVVQEVLDNRQVRVVSSPYKSLHPGIVIAGCDPGLQLLSDTAGNITKQQVLWRNADNRQAQRLLAQGYVHAAAVHIPAAESHLNSTSSDDVMLKKTSGFDPIDFSSGAEQRGVRRFHFATWQLGWIVKRGNPTGFRDASDFATGRFRLANRQSGAGTRKLLDKLLSEAGVDSLQIPGYPFELESHLQVALAVETGAADVGIALSSVAGPLRLDFMPIHTEHCELWIPSQHIQVGSVQGMVDALVSDPFRWELASIGDYDVAQTGIEL